MSKKLTITDAKVIEAAEKHREAKDVLHTLFPDAFKGYNKISVRFKDLKIEDRGSVMIRLKDNDKILMQTSHLMHGFALQLNTEDFNWEIKNDQLIPTTKKHATSNH